MQTIIAIFAAIALLIGTLHCVFGCSENEAIPLPKNARMHVGVVK